jgi:CDP-diacylglycerol--glycerol-3-phosphate 3-phosphatidyltransferase
MATSLGEPATGSPPRVQERFWNLPNTITVVRMVAVPVLLLFPWFHDPVSSRIVAWIFIVAATTDIVDGWLARRGQQVTKIGKLLDPLADKLIVASALVVLIAAGGRIPLWGVPLAVVIIGRELAVTSLRSIASVGGQVLAATWRGKAKALSQNIAIAALLFPAGTLGIDNHALGMAFLALATVLTLWSGYVYFADYFGTPGEPAAPPGSPGASES